MVFTALQRGLSELDAFVFTNHEIIVMSSLNYLSQRAFRPVLDLGNSPDVLLGGD